MTKENYCNRVCFQKVLCISQTVWGLIKYTFPHARATKATEGRMKTRLGTRSGRLRDAANSLAPKGRCGSRSCGNLGVGTAVHRPECSGSNKIIGPATLGARWKVTIQHLSHILLQRIINWLGSTSLCASSIWRFHPWMAMKLLKSARSIVLGISGEIV